MGDKKLNVLITGSSGSLGSYLSEEFLKDGCWVTGIDKEIPKNSALEKKYAGSWRFLECDLTQGGQVRKTLDDAHKPKGAYDLVINNAGLIYNAPLLSIQNGVLSAHAFDDWDKAVASNLNAGFYVTALCAEKMVSTAHPGVIINISSVCSQGNAGQSAYSAAKAGVNAMTMALAKELGPMGVRVAAISPGYLDTASTRAHMDAKHLELVRQAVPLRKLGETKDLMSAVLFILKNDYFHGKVLELDGGLTL